MPLLNFESPGMTTEPSRFQDLATGRPRQARIPPTMTGRPALTPSDVCLRSPRITANSRAYRYGVDDPDGRGVLLRLRG